MRLKIIDFLLIGLITVMLTFGLVWAANFYPFSNGLDGGAAGDLDAKTGTADKDAGIVIVNADSVVTDFRAVTGAMGSAYSLNADGAAVQSLPGIVDSGDAGNEDWNLVPWMAQGFYSTDGATGPGWVRLFEDQDNGNSYGTIIGQSSLAANVTWTMPAGTTTIVGDDTTNTLTNKTFDANGAGNSLSNVDLTADVIGITPTANGGTGIAYFTATGPTVARVYTFPDAAATILYSGGPLGTPSSATLTNASGYPAATTTSSGISELAIASELNTGTDATRAVSPDSLAGSNYGTEVIGVLVFDDSQDTAVGDGAGDVFFRIPSKLNGWNLVSVAAQVQTAGTTGNLDIMIYNVTDTADFLSTAMRIETGETDTSTSAQPGTINTATDDVATGDSIRIDVDTVQTTAAKGLYVELQFRLP